MGSRSEAGQIRQRRNPFLAPPLLDDRGNGAIPAHGFAMPTSGDADSMGNYHPPLIAFIA